MKEIRMSLVRILSVVAFIIFSSIQSANAQTNSIQPDTGGSAAMSIEAWELPKIDRRDPGEVIEVFFFCLLASVCASAFTSLVLDVARRYVSRRSWKWPKPLGWIQLASMIFTLSGFVVLVIMLMGPPPSAFGPSVDFF